MYVCVCIYTYFHCSWAVWQRQIMAGRFVLLRVLHGEGSSLPFARDCRLGVWFGFVGAALLPAVGTCVVLAFGAMPGRCCFLRVTRRRQNTPSNTQEPKQRSTQQKTTARSGTNLSKPSHTPTRYTRVKHSISLHIAHIVNAHMSHVYRDAPACTRTSGGRPPITYTHRPSSPLRVWVQYSARRAGGGLCRGGMGGRGVGGMEAGVVRGLDEG